MAKQYETVIGLEVHVELATRTKIFCGCSTAFGAPPNTQTCPVCTGMPGALPVLNRRVVELAAGVGLAVNCTVSPLSRFDRKNYFYPDNPQNYQISQLYLPICQNGYLEIDTDHGVKRIGIHEIHMEEDAGKLIHDEWEDATLVDYNRSGVPLIELVTEPDMGSADEVTAFLEKLRLQIQYLGASDCRLQEGSMRVDVNLSVRETGCRELGTRTEMKNLNSFKAIARAIEHESARQKELLEEGKKVIQETRRWDDNKEYSYAMRSKEDARDYRYFPDPDLPPVIMEEKWLQSIRMAQPEFREARKKRYRKEYGLPDYDIDILTGSRALADLFEEAARICGQPKKVSNWLMVETMRLLKDNQMEPEDIKFSPENLAALVELTRSGAVNSSVAKEIFQVMFRENIKPEEYAREKGLLNVEDNDLLYRTASRIMAEYPQSVQDYRNGKAKALGYLVGQTMKAMQGKTDPAAVNRILKELLLEASV